MASTITSETCLRESESHRPTALSALFGLPVSATWTAGVALFACLWLPQVTGCDGIEVRPIDRLEKADGIGARVGALYALWPHWFGMLTALLLFAVAVARPPEPGRWLIVAPGVVWGCLLAGLCVAIGVEAQGAGKDFLETVMWLPVLAAPGVWAGLAVRRHQWLAAWARLTSALAVLAYGTLVLSTLFSSGGRYGLTISLVAVATLVPMPWVLYWRGRRTLVDRTAPAEPLRFRLSHLIAYTTTIAGMCGYYRFVAWMSG